MNQKTAKLIRKFINNGNSDMNDVEKRYLVRQTKKKYVTFTNIEKEDFKQRIK